MHRTTVLRAHGKALAPEAAAAGGRSGADTVGLVFLQQLTAAAEQAGRILEFMYALTERLILLTVPDLAETLLLDISEGMVPYAALVVPQVGVRCVEQTHAGRDVPIPADEAVALLNEATPVGASGHGFSLPGEQLRLLKTPFIGEKQIFVAC